MDKNALDDLIAKHWVHSHEEDEGQQLVYRPATYQFPPSRGRTSFQLNPDGTLMRSQPSPTDQKQTQEGHWSVEGSKLTLSPAADQAPQVLQVKTLTPDRLVVQREV
jgi:hypothetical protein